MAVLANSTLGPAGVLGPDRGPRNNSTSLRRALRVLDGVGQYQGQPSGISLTSLAASLGMSKSTVLRLIGPLRDEGLLYQDHDSGRYRLGPAVARLGGAFVARVDLDLLAVDLFRDLTKQTRERVSIVVPGSVCRTAGALVLLAATVPGTVALGGQAQRIAESLRDRGWWAEIDSEARGTGTVAAPVRDHRSRVVAAIESALPSGGLRAAGSAVRPLAHLAGLGSVVRDCAASLSDRLGAPLSSSDPAQSGNP